MFGFKGNSQYQLASMMGFVLNRSDGSFLKRLLSQQEVAAVHERLPQLSGPSALPCFSNELHACVYSFWRCLTWGRIPGNNKVLEFYGTTFEAYANAADTLCGRLRSVLPEGSTRCRIRASARETRTPQTGTLMDTLGEETVGMVIVDPSCVSPMRYSQLKILSGIVGKSSVRIEVDRALDRDNVWRNMNASIDTTFVDDTWRKDFTAGAHHCLKEKNVTVTDPHYV